MQEEEIPEDIIKMAQDRDQAKSEKNYALADTLRAQILAAGFIVKDTKDGTVVERE